MILKELAVDLSIVQVLNFQSIDLSLTPIFIGKTKEEISVVLPTHAVIFETINREDGWKALKIEGILDFSLVGILSKISTILAEHSISIFALSTYNTDYILVKKDVLSKAKQVLSKNGYECEME